jgi:hypothetical protein
MFVCPFVKTYPSEISRVHVCTLFMETSWCQKHFDVCETSEGEFGGIVWQSGMVCEYTIPWKLDMQNIYGFQNVLVFSGNL